MKKLVAFLLFTIPVLQIHAQTPSEQCGYRYEVERLLKRQPNFLIWQDAWYKDAMNSYFDLQSAKRDQIVKDTLFFEIPVVFHILYNNAAENVHDSLIHNQMIALNQAFRKLTADTARIREVFKPLAADVRIQFKLTTVDENGNPHSGIIRKSTAKTTFATNIYGQYSQDMKDATDGGSKAWDPTRFLNIWVCDMEFPNFLAVVYGFATPPTGAPNWDGFSNSTKDTNDLESGVVLHYKVVGVNNPLAPQNKYKEGKTAVHEVGHFLGLRHVWGDGNAATGCSVDDGIFDTPNARYSNSTCQSQNTCNEGNGDLPDQTENYMDYALDGCAAMFTKQQAFMMQYVLNYLRPSLPHREIVTDTIETTLDEPAIVIYPNPVNNQSNLFISIDEKTSKKYSFSLIDACGRRVTGRSFESNWPFSFSLDAIASGVYFLILKDATGQILRKVKVVVN